MSKTSGSKQQPWQRHSLGNSGSWLLLNDSQYSSSRRCSRELRSSKAGTWRLFFNCSTIDIAELMLRSTRGSKIMVFRYCRYNGTEEEDEGDCRSCLRTKAMVDLAFPACAQSIERIKSILWNETDRPTTFDFLNGTERSTIRSIQRASKPQNLGTSLFWMWLSLKIGSSNRQQRLWSVDHKLEIEWQWLDGIELLVGSKPETLQLLSSIHILFAWSVSMPPSCIHLQSQKSRSLRPRQNRGRRHRNWTELIPCRVLERCGWSPPKQGVCMNSYELDP